MGPAADAGGCAGHRRCENDVRKCGQIPGYGLQPIEKRWVDDDMGDIRLSQLVAEDIPLVFGVDRNIDGAGARSAEPGVDERKRVRGHDTDLRSLADSQVRQTIGYATGRA